MEELQKWRHSLPEKGTLEEAAKRLGVTPATVSRYETGKRKIPATKCADIARITGIPKRKLRPDIFGSA